MKHFITSLFFFLFLGVNISHATVFAGEITFRQTGPLEIEASVYLYIRESAVPPQANYSPICWGDGNCTSIPITNGEDANGDGFPNGQIVGTEYRLMIYTGTYIYEEAGTYTLSVRSFNRPFNVLNINSPNSDQAPFHVYAKVKVSETEGGNHAPILYERPLIDEAVVGIPYEHTPNAFDPDGDEVRYQLETPTIDDTIAFPNYQTPEVIMSGPDNQLFIDPLTGVVQWDSPPRSGRYVIAIKVSTFRDGILQDEIVRDMVIVVRDAMELPPQLNLSDETPLREISVGDTLLISASASSLPENDMVTLTATGGPFEFFGETASFESMASATEAEGQFEWIAGVEDARAEPYQIVFKAREPESGLSTLIPIRIRVSAVTNANQQKLHADELQVFPNPALDNVRIDIPAAVKGDVNYQLVNAQGQAVTTGVFGSRPAQLNMSNLPAGWYVLRCWQPGQAVGWVRILK